MLLLDQCVGDLVVSIRLEGSDHATANLRVASRVERLLNLGWNSHT